MAVSAEHEGSGSIFGSAMNRSWARFHSASFEFKPAYMLIFARIYTDM